MLREMLRNQVSSLESLGGAVWISLPGAQRALSEALSKAFPDPQATVVRSPTSQRLGAGVGAGRKGLAQGHSTGWW